MKGEPGEPLSAAGVAVVHRFCQRPHSMAVGTMVSGLIPKRSISLIDTNLFLRHSERLVCGLASIPKNLNVRFYTIEVQIAL